MKMAARQLLKYKFQTFVSMLCMGIGLTINGYIKLVLDVEFGGSRDEIRLYITNASQSAGEYGQLEEKRVEGIENLRAATVRPHQANAFVEGKPELPYEVNVFGMTPDLFRHSLSSSMERHFKVMAGRDSIGRNEVLVSNGLAKRIYGKDSAIGKSITLVADAGGENDYTGCSYRIAGILNTGDDSERYVNFLSRFANKFRANCSAPRFYRSHSRTRSIILDFLRLRKKGRQNLGWAPSRMTNGAERDDFLCILTGAKKIYNLLM